MLYIGFFDNILIYSPSWESSHGALADCLLNSDATSFLS